MLLWAASPSAGTPEADLQLSSDTDAPGGPTSNDGWYVSASGPGTTGSFGGMIGILVNADADRCQFNFTGTAL